MVGCWVGDFGLQEVLVQRLVVVEEGGDVDGEVVVEFADGQCVHQHVTRPHTVHPETRVACVTMRRFILSKKSYFFQYYTNSVLI